LSTADNNENMVANADFYAFICHIFMTALQKAHNLLLFLQFIDDK